MGNISVRLTLSISSEFFNSTRTLSLTPFYYKEIEKVIQELPQPVLEDMVIQAHIISSIAKRALRERMQERSR